MASNMTPTNDFFKGSLDGNLKLVKQVAALNGRYEDVMILYRMTSSIPSIQDWSCAVIIKYVDSKEANQQVKLKRKDVFLSAKSKGDQEFEMKDYLNAICWYSEARHLDPTNAIVLSKRSMCLAQLNEGSLALSNAHICLSLNSDWWEGYYIQGVAWKLLHKFHKAAESFHGGLKLDPNNKE